VQTKHARSLAGLAVILAAGVGSANAQQNNQKKGPAGPPMTMTIPAFKDGAETPVKYSCSNAPSGVSPEIQWENPPAGTASFAILLHDPEPHPQKSMYDNTHWLVWDLPGTLRSLPEGVPATGDLANGAHQAKGPRGDFGYFGPCAPPGPVHHYTFEVYALDNTLGLPAGSSRGDVMKAMDGHILAAAIYITLFHR
jgi:Raf kinase inhibitor-like YbhB/YbcL family protein